MLQNINPHSNAPLLARELQGVGQKVDEHLYVPPLVPKYRLNQLQIYVVVDLRLKLYLFLRGGELQNLKCLVNCAWQVEVVVGQLERVALELRKIKEVVDQVLHHLGGELESLEKLNLTGDFR